MILAFPPLLVLLLLLQLLATKTTTALFTATAIVLLLLLRLLLRFLQELLLRLLRLLLLRLLLAQGKRGLSLLRCFRTSPRVFFTRIMFVCLSSEALLQASLHLFFFLVIFSPPLPSCTVADNHVYGFDPHDDSDYLTITDNTCFNNGEELFFVFCSVLFLFFSM